MDITHANCGGTLTYVRRVDYPERCNTCGADERSGCYCPPSRQSSAVVVCDRCGEVVTSVDDLQPAGAVCAMSAA